MPSNSLLAKDIRPNGFYFNLLFILYYLFLAPCVNRCILFGEKNLFVEWLGIAVYAADFFARVNLQNCVATERLALKVHSFN